MDIRLIIYCDLMRLIKIYKTEDLRWETYVGIAARHFKTDPDFLVNICLRAQQCMGTLKIPLSIVLYAHAHKLHMFRVNSFIFNR